MSEFAFKKESLVSDIKLEPVSISEPTGEALTIPSESLNTYPDSETRHFSSADTTVKPEEAEVDLPYDEFHEKLFERPLRPNEIFSIVFAVAAGAFMTYVLYGNVIGAFIGAAVSFAMKSRTLTAIGLYLLSFGKSEAKKRVHKAAESVLQERVDAFKGWWSKKFGKKKKVEENPA